MHQNPAFRKTPEAKALAFARERSFGVLTLAGPDGPLASHIPFLIREDGASLEAHILRSNPIWAAITDPAPALMIISGPDAYISPDWYGIPDQVPTWNYIAVHLRGTLCRLDQSELAPHSARLSAEMEARLLPKPPWTLDKMNPDTLARMQRMIVPIEMSIDTIESTWKLNQNKTPDAISGAIKGLQTDGPGQERERLAAMMRDETEGS